MLRPEAILQTGRHPVCASLAQDVALDLCANTSIAAIIPRMRKHVCLWVLVFLICVTVAVGVQSRSPAIRIPFETYTLPNGLTVVLAPDPATPTIAVTAWYHVGSKDEVPGRTGFAHLFEHVMFTGAGHTPYGVHDRL